MFVSRRRNEITSRKEGTRTIRLVLFVSLLFPPFPYLYISAVSLIARVYLTRVLEHELKHDFSANVGGVRMSGTKIRASTKVATYARFLNAPR